MSISSNATNFRVVGTCGSARTFAWNTQWFQRQGEIDDTDFDQAKIRTQQILNQVY